MLPTGQRPIEPPIVIQPDLDRDLDSGFRARFNSLSSLSNMCQKNMLRWTWRQAPEVDACFHPIDLPVG